MGRPLATACAVAAALLAIAVGGTAPTSGADSDGPDKPEAHGTAPLGDTERLTSADSSSTDPLGDGSDSDTKQDEDAKVAAPVRVADADAARLLSTGDLVDVFAAPPPDTPGLGSGTGAEADAEASRQDGQETVEDAAPAAADTPRALRVAHRARVAEVPPPSAAEEIDPFTGALVVIEVSPADAAVLAAAAADSRLTVTRW